MATLHTFGCSITQGFALPDVVRPVLDDGGRPLTESQLAAQGIDWSDIHLYQPSEWAWPRVLASLLGCPVINHARRGACFQQIARQCAVAQKNIQPQDVVIVMWTYLSRLSLQWPARTAVPFCNIVNPHWGWQTVRLGFNKLMGLERAQSSPPHQDEEIQRYIHNATRYTYLNPRGVYNTLYNHMVLQQITDGFLRATGARVIHLSVETESAPRQLERARGELEPSLREPQHIPHPTEWYHLTVDHRSCAVILDPRIDRADNDMHPSVTHHRNFAEHIHQQYFRTTEN